MINSKDETSAVVDNMINLAQSMDIQPIQFHFGVIAYLVDSLFACRNFFGKIPNAKADEIEYKNVYISLVNSNIYWFNRLIEPYNPNVKMELGKDDIVRIVQR